MVKKDRETIKTIYRQINPVKKQPTQGSFKPTRQSNQIGGSNISGMGDSFINHSAMNENQMHLQGDYTEDNVLDFAKGGTVDRLKF